MVHKYDAKIGPARTACHLLNTVLPSVFTSVEFWAMFLAHMVIYIIKHGNMAPQFFESFQLEWKFVTVISGITTFFQVFYANQCYGRYQNLYAMTKNVISEAQCVIYMLQVYVKETAEGYATLSTRYILAAFLLHFYGVLGPRDVHLQRLQSGGFLKRIEVEILLTHNPEHRHIVVMSWASYVTKIGLDEARAPAAIHSMFLSRVLNLYQRQQDIGEQLELPVPFQYFHLLSIMLLVNLALWAYAMAASGSLFAPLVYFSSSFIFTGMMELSSELADPFGKDEVDFPLEMWLRRCVELIIDFSQTKFLHSKDAVARTVQGEIPLPHNAHEGVRLDLDENDEATEKEAVHLSQLLLGGSSGYLSSSGAEGSPSKFVSPKPGRNSMNRNGDSRRAFMVSTGEEDEPFVKMARASSIERGEARKSSPGC